MHPLPLSGCPRRTNKAPDPIPLPSSAQGSEESTDASPMCSWRPHASLIRRKTKEKDENKIRSDRQLCETTAGGNQIVWYMETPLYMEMHIRGNQIVWYPVVHGIPGFTTALLVVNSNSDFGIIRSRTNANRSFNRSISLNLCSSSTPIQTLCILMVSSDSFTHEN